MSRGMNVYVFVSVLLFSSMPAFSIDRPLHDSIAGRGRLEVREIAGDIQGFDVFDENGYLVAPIRFSANEAFRPVTVERTDDRSLRMLRFTDFVSHTDSGLKLTPDSFITAIWEKEESFPKVVFGIGIESFDVGRWTREYGRIPFHFLTCSMPEAEAFHMRGWLIATPLADPFPLHQAPHAGHPEIQSAWSENWSYAPAVGCHPIPVIGLWGAHHQRYIAYDFSETRRQDNSARSLGTAYCWDYNSHSQFVTLTYPASEEAVDRLAYPHAGDGIVSAFQLVWSTDMPPTQDPNRFLMKRLARERRIPAVPPVNDLDYMPGSTRLDSFTEARPRNIIAPGHETRFYKPGTVVIHGWKTHVGPWVSRWIETGGDDAKTQLKKQAERLLRSAKRFRVDGDHCVYWEKPIEGVFRAEFGGEPAATLHNSDGFASARMLLNLWKHDPNPHYLEAADGALNWARHIVWTRNEFVDVPSAPFAIGGSLPIAFLLDYHSIFKDDPNRAQDAEEALDLAVTFAYRYLPVWLSDNNRSDVIDSTFLLEPNAGRDWTGAACANEVTWQIEAVAEVILASGDPVLKQILHGILERWPLLYADRYQSSVAEYGRSAFTECFGLYPGCAVGAGRRANYGWAEPFHLLYPPGSTKVRILCGEKTSFVTNRDGKHTRVEQYHAGDGFSFEIVSEFHGPFAVAVSVPRVDLRTLPIKRQRDGNTITLQPGTDYSLSSERSDSLILHRVEDEDTFIIGEPLESTADTETSKDRRNSMWARGSRHGVRLGLTEPKPKRQNQSEEEDSTGMSVAPYEIVEPDDTKSLRCDWFDTDSTAGLFAGIQFALGVPFRIERDEWGNPGRWETPIRLPRSHRKKGLFIFWIPTTSDSELRVSMSDGEEARISPAGCAVARRGWPPIFRWRLLFAYLPSDGGRRVTRVDVNNGIVTSITALSPEVTPKTDIVSRFQQARDEWREELAFENKIRRLNLDASLVDLSQLGILPPYEAGGTMARLFFETGIQNEAERLERAELTDPSILNPERFPVLLFSGGENYVHTVRNEGDASSALIEYCRRGGTLMIAGAGPYPMYYGMGRPGTPAGPFPPNVGIPIVVVPDSRSTAGWTIRNETQSSHFNSLPKEFDFPIGGDRRIRPIDRASIPKSCDYKPLLSVYDSDGNLVGDAAAWLVYKSGPLEGFSAFYIWGPLLGHGKYGREISLCVVSEIIETVGKH